MHRSSAGSHLDYLSQRFAWQPSFILELPVTIIEAVLGAKVAVPTLGGSVSLTVPKHSDTGRQLRLRGRGIPAHAGRPVGDLYVTLKVMVGVPDEALEEALRAYAERNPGDIRRGMEEAA